METFFYGLLGTVGIILFTVLSVVLPVGLIVGLGFFAYYLWKKLIKSAIRESKGCENEKPLEKMYVRDIAIKKMTDDGIHVNDIADITHEFGNKFQGTLFSDKGIYNVSIWADKSGSVTYTLSEKTYS